MGSEWARPARRSSNEFLQNYSCHLLSPSHLINKSEREIARESLLQSILLTVSVILMISIVLSLSGQMGSTLAVGTGMARIFMSLVTATTYLFGSPSIP